MRWFGPILFLTILFCLIPAAEGAACAVCGRTGSRSYVSEGRHYCSRSCWEKSLPKCSVCARPLAGKYLSAGGKLYCSQRCFDTVLPKCSVCGSTIRGEYTVALAAGKHFFCPECAKLPHCFVCTLPARLTPLPDGRGICKTCDRDTVTDPAKAETLFREVRREVDRLLGSRTPCRLEFHLVGREELNRLLGNRAEGEASELGLYRLEQTIWQPGNRVEEKCSVYLLDHLPHERFIEVAAHELAHDWQHHAAPGLSDPVRREGFAEYVASRINLKHNRAALNSRMEQNVDPVYGGGYRMIRDLARQKGWRAVVEELKRR